MKTPTKGGEDYNAAVDWQDTHEVKLRQGQSEAVTSRPAVFQWPSKEGSGAVEVV